MQNTVRDIRLLERNKKILEEYRKVKLKRKQEDALQIVGDKFFLSKSQINQIIFNKKLKHSPYW